MTRLPIILLPLTFAFHPTPKWLLLKRHVPKSEFGHQEDDTSITITELIQVRLEYKKPDPSWIVSQFSNNQVPVSLIDSI